LPKGATKILLANAREVTTLAGTMRTNEKVYLRDLRLPEFDKNRRIYEIKAPVFNQKTQFDIILGSNFLNKSGIDLKYSNSTMNWFKNSLKIREPWALNNAEYVEMSDAFDVQSEEEDLFGKDWLESYLTNTILDTKYKNIDIADVPEK